MHIMFKLYLICLSPGQSLMLFPYLYTCCLSLAGYLGPSSCLWPLCRLATSRPWGPSDEVASGRLVSLAGI